MTARMRYREQRFECGDHLEVNVFPVFGQLTGTSRRAKRKPTKAVQEKLNQHNREKEVNRVICANFTDDDLYITLTFKQSPADADEANKIFRLFIDKINRRRSKKNLSKVKYVKTVEVGARTGRIHLHLVMSGDGLTAKDISEVWGRGYVDVKPLQFDAEGCMGLSKYFVKEKKTGGQKQGTSSRSWTCSRNCVRPQPKNADYKYTKREVKEMVSLDTAKDVLKKKYPDYFVAGCDQFYRDETGLYYIYARLCKKTAKLNI